MQTKKSHILKEPTKFIKYKILTIRFKNKNATHSTLHIAAAAASVAAASAAEAEISAYLH